MATVKEIKRRMRSIKNIAQTTKAVQMVAVVKMQRAQEQALRGQPYSEKMNEILQVLAQKTDPRFHPLLQKGGGKKTLILLMTPNKGLCGGLLSNLTKKLFELLSETPCDFILVGKKGENLLLKRGQKPLAEFSNLPDQPLFSEILPISKIVMNEFTGGKYEKVFILHSHFINTLSQQPTLNQILPIETKQQEEKKWQDVLYEPHPKAILENLLPFYVELLVYHLILESIASEHSARMMAMKNATENASEILGNLTLTYNQLRQATITQEVAEIAAARTALKYHE